MIEEAKREALAVQVALAMELETVGLPVVPVICVHRARLPWLGAAAGGVRIVVRQGAGQATPQGGAAAAARRGGIAGQCGRHSASGRGGSAGVEGAEDAFLRSLAAPHSR